MKEVRIGKQPRFVVIVLLVLWNSSCNLLYLPNKVNAPMLSDTGDFSGNVGLGSTNINLQAAFSPFQNVGLMLNYAGGNKKNTSSTINKSSYGFFEFGLGYYTPIENNKLVDLYGGYGTGYAITYDDSFSGEININGKYSRFFLQPSISIYVTEVFDANFAVRSVVVIMDKTINTLTSQSTSYFLEPTITIQYGWKYVKFFNQVGLSFRTREMPYAYNPFIVNVGVNFRLNSIIDKVSERINLQQ